MNDITIRFGYPNHTIPANVLTEYLKNLDLIIKDISSYHGNTNELIIVATEEGSFEIIAFLQEIGQSDIGQTIKYMVDSEEKRFILTALGGIVAYFSGLSAINSRDPITKQESGEEITLIDMP